MGSGTAPNLGVPGTMPLILPAFTGIGMISQQVPGIMPPPPVISPGAGISMLPGIETMSMIRSGPVTMVIGPGLTPIMDPGLMMMTPVITPGLSSMGGPMMMEPIRIVPIMIMDPMMITNPSMMVQMNIDPMMNMDPMIRMGPMNMEQMMIMDPTKNMDPMMRTGPMNMYQMMNTDSIMRTVPMNMFPYFPEHMDSPDKDTPSNKNDLPKEIIQNNVAASCLACHKHEDIGMIEYSLIIKIFHGHFSHQNCIVCHVPHGSQLPGLLRDLINWNKQNRSCNTGSIEGCHTPYVHNPPLEGTIINYEVRPEATCNVDSCHKGSINKGGMTGN